MVVGAVVAAGAEAAAGAVVTGFMQPVFPAGPEALKACLPGEAP